jgi:hypothetical protein
MWARAQTPPAASFIVGIHSQIDGATTMKKSRGGRMTAAKRRAARSTGGRGLVKNRSAGRRIMKS